MQVSLLAVSMHTSAIMFKCDLFLHMKRTSNVKLDLHRRFGEKREFHGVTRLRI